MTLVNFQVDLTASVSVHHLHIETHIKTTRDT